MGQLVSALKTTLSPLLLVILAFFLNWEAILPEIFPKKIFSLKLCLQNSSQLCFLNNTNSFSNNFIVIASTAAPLDLVADYHLPSTTISAALRSALLISHTNL
ncbi:hypothetical protein QCI44_28810 [Bacillus cereus group sp. RP37]|uniref:hypothetical protein n=1 Tax=Bacillus cereus group sp. RP37 TaxID=3040259 RepID=UPI0033969448